MVTRELDGVWTCPQCGVDRNSRTFMNAPYIVHCDKCEGMRSAMLATEIASMSGKEVDQHLKDAGLNPLALVERLLNLIKEK